MNSLNYHHLYYFYSVSKLGSVTAAARELRVAQPTISAQLRDLEESLGEKLFERNGRYLSLTETGQIVQRYCKQIFELGDELFAVIEGRSVGHQPVLKIGISDVMPKLIAYSVIEPVFQLAEPRRVSCIEGGAEMLLGKLAIHEIDLVIADCPIPPSVDVIAYNHQLGSCGTSFLGAEELWKAAHKHFPSSLSEVPLLLPTEHAAVRRELDRWFHAQGVTLSHAHEFQDSALLKIFGSEGCGVFPVPTILEREVCEEMGVKVVGRIDDHIEHFYLITPRKTLRDPAIAKMCEKAAKRFKQRA